MCLNIPNQYIPAIKPFLLPPTLYQSSVMKIHILRNFHYHRHNFILSLYHREPSSHPPHPTTLSQPTGQLTVLHVILQLIDRDLLPRDRGDEVVGVGLHLLVRGHLCLLRVVVLPDLDPSRARLRRGEVQHVTLSSGRKGRGRRLGLLGRLQGWVPAFQGWHCGVCVCGGEVLGRINNIHDT